MIEASRIKRIVNGSIEYFVKDHIMTIRDYYNYQRSIQIDLTKLTPEILEKLKPDEEEEEDE